MITRAGIGFDAHKFAENRRLILGGVDIPHTHGLDGHSDADVLVHAIMDALLGAAALGDIGTHFPDTDPRYKGISSILLLKEVGKLLENNGYGVVNIDSVIIAQSPKLMPFAEQMRLNICSALCLDTDAVSIKATTTEYMGYTGRKEGIASMAIASIMKITE